MAWIESHQSLATHRKTLALRRLLGISRAQAIGHLHLLWWWCLDNAPDGKLEGIDPSDLGVAMDWSGDANTIIGALLNVGFIDRDMKVHAWDEYAGKLIIQRASNAEKQRRHREKQSQLLLSPLRNRDITVTSPSRNGATVPNRTQPNSTVPIKEISIKKKYGQFENVHLTDEEYERLKIRFNSSLQEKIEELSIGIASKGYKYKSHYATILSWERKREKDGGQNGTNRQNPRHSTRLPDRNTGYTEPPPDPALVAAVRAAHPDSPPAQH